MTAPIPPFPVAALAGIWLAGRRCTRHMHDDPAPCPACCYTDNGYCGCQCHETNERSTE